MSATVVPAADEEDLIVGGTRIRDEDGFCGTVVYVGPVASAKQPTECYVGICWDDPSRGRHDGSVIDRHTNALVRHFGPTPHPTQGSFLRVTKIDTGVPLTAELLHGRYVELSAPIIAPNNRLPHFVRTAQGKEQKPIEFLGELQIRGRQQVQDLSKWSLRRQGISKPASTERDILQLRQLAAGVIDLDLAGNLLSQWTDVVTIVGHFPKLTNLNLAFNRIRNVPPSVPSAMSLGRLTILNLHSCGITTFQTVQWIAREMPQLQELCLAYSALHDMEHFPLPIHSFSCMTILDCSHCHLSDWTTQICNLQSLPQLQQLSLDGNPISYIPTLQKISCKQQQQQQQQQQRQHSSELLYFPSLQAILLAGTTIASWSDLEGINSLPRLTSLRCQSTPLTSTMGQGEARASFIARIPSLKQLNGSTITIKERFEAEKRYVSFVTRRLLAMQSQQENTENCDGDNNGNGNSNDDHGKHTNTDNDDTTTSTERWIQREHPRYIQLREQHQDLIAACSQQCLLQTNGSLSGSVLSVVNVKIISQAPSSCDQEPIHRRLPGTLSIGRLKALCARAFGGIDVDLMTLHFRIEVRPPLKKN